MVRARSQLSSSGLLHEPQPMGHGNCLGARAGSQLAEHGANLVLNCSPTHAVALGDLGVLETLREEGEDLTLPRRQACRMGSRRGPGSARDTTDPERPQ